MEEIVENEVEVVEVVKGEKKKKEKKKKRKEEKPIFTLYNELEILEEYDNIVRPEVNILGIFEKE